MNDRMWTALLRRPTPLSPAEAGARLRAAERVLLVGPHLGRSDLFAATPIFRNLRLALPGTELVLLASRLNLDAVGDSPDLDRVEVTRLRGLTLGPRTLGLVRRLERARFDVSLVLPSPHPMAFAVYLARAARPGFTAGVDDAPLDRSLARQGFDCVIPAPGEERVHLVDMALTLVEGLGIPVVERGHVLGVTDAQRTAAEAALLEAGLDPARPVLGIQPGGTARSPGTHWPPSHYATVLQRAAAELDFQTVLLGKRGDADTIRQVRELGKREIPILTDLPFPLYKAVLSRLDFFLTQDGERVHVAAGVGVPSYFIYLGSPPWRSAPYGPHVAVWAEERRPPAPNEVWERVKPLLVAAAERRRGGPR
jgi:ADP-heptose:LPS heptosyltransferase